MKKSKIETNQDPPVAHQQAGLFVEKPTKLIENEHFYWENGLFVFTERYLRERGFCCQSGCRHCPYGFQK